MARLARVLIGLRAAQGLRYGRDTMNITESVQTLERLIAKAAPDDERRYKIEILAYYQVMNGRESYATGLCLTEQEQRWYDEAKQEAQLKRDIEGD